MRGALGRCFAYRAAHSRKAPLPVGPDRPLDAGGDAAESLCCKHRHCSPLATQRVEPQIPVARGSRGGAALPTTYVTGHVTFGHAGRRIRETADPEQRRSAAQATSTVGGPSDRGHKRWPLTRGRAHPRSCQSGAPWIGSPGDKQGGRPIGSRAPEGHGSRAGVGRKQGGCDAEAGRQCDGSRAERNGEQATAQAALQPSLHRARFRTHPAPSTLVARVAPHATPPGPLQRARSSARHHVHRAACRALPRSPCPPQTPRAQAARPSPHPAPASTPARGILPPWPPPSPCAAAAPRSTPPTPRPCATPSSPKSRTRYG